MAVIAERLKDIHDGLLALEALGRREIVPVIRALQ